MNQGDDFRSFPMSHVAGQRVEFLVGILDEEQVSFVQPLQDVEQHECLDQEVGNTTASLDVGHHGDITNALYKAVDVLFGFDGIDLDVIVDRFSFNG